MQCAMDAMYTTTGLSRYCGTWAVNTDHVIYVMMTSHSALLLSSGWQFLGCWLRVYIITYSYNQPRSYHSLQCPLEQEFTTIDATKKHTILLPTLRWFESYSIINLLQYKTVEIETPLRTRRIGSSPSLSQKGRLKIVSTLPSDGLSEEKESCGKTLMEVY